MHNRQYKKYVFDAFFCIVVIVYAILAHNARLATSMNGVWLGMDSDLADIASYLAGKHFPANFANDMLLSEAGNTSWYRTALQFYAEAVVADGDFATALLKITAPTLMVFYIGFYILGVVLLKRRWPAAAFAVVSGFTFSVPGTFWGIEHISLVPRTTYAALVGILLASAYTVRNKPKWHPVLMLIAGACVYAHSPSALVLGTGIFFGFALYRQPGWTVKNHLKHMIICGFSFICAPSTFMWPMLQATPPLSTEDAALVQYVMEYRFNPDMVHYAQGLKKFFIRFFIDKPLCLLALISVPLIYFCGNKEQKDALALLLLWILGILLAAVGVLAVDQEIASIANRPSLQIQLIRGMRLLVPMSIILCFLSLSVFFHKKQRHVKLIAGVLVCIFCIYMYTISSQSLSKFTMYYYTGYLENDKEIKKLERHRAQYATYIAAIEAIEALTTPQDAIFTASSDTASPALLIRHKPKRSLVYAFKDGAMLVFTKKIQKLKEWLALSELIKHSPTGYIDAWQQTNANYLLCQAARKQDLPVLEQVGVMVWQDEHFMLLKRK